MREVAGSNWSFKITKEKVLSLVIHSANGDGQCMNSNKTTTSQMTTHANKVLIVTVTTNLSLLFFTCGRCN